MMPAKRKVEIFSAGCPICQETIELVYQLACPSCEIIVHDMQDLDVLLRAKELGVKSVPAVAINNTLADCCHGRGVDVEVLKEAGIGIPSG